MVSYQKLKSRGSSTNPANRFTSRQSVVDKEYDIKIRSGQQSRHYFPATQNDGESTKVVQTQYIAQQCRSIISTNDSPDIPFRLSINPYQGCEHGCVYCYARPTHEYLDLSLGLDFETKIHYKPNALQKLEEYLSRPGYQCEPITLGANTDPYQQAERQFGITRSLLQLALDCRQPVVIITKGSLVLRDIDLLKALARQHLVKVMITLTTLKPELKSTLEPRAAAPATRLKIIETLAQMDVPVGVLVAPVIPAINDMEIEAIIEQCAKLGAGSMSHILLRLPHQLKDLFQDWLTEYYPERRHKVLHLLEQCHGGQLYKSEFGTRQTGTGIYARMISQRFSLSCQKHGISHKRETLLRRDLFIPPQQRQQIDLFEA